MRDSSDSASPSLDRDVESFEDNSGSSRVRPSSRPSGASGAAIAVETDHDAARRDLLPGRVDVCARGILALMVEHWAKSQDAVDREEALADMDDMLDDEESVPHRPEHRPYVRFTDLAKVTSTVVEHKKRLREIIDKHGGVTAVARLAGIPQPSLSRMLNSASMPRRATLYRIANALDLSEPEIVGEFVR